MSASYAPDPTGPAFPSSAKARVFLAIHNALAKRNGIKIPTGFNATSITLSLGYDAANANYKTMVGISRTLSKVAFKQVLSGGAVQYGYGYMNVSEFPSLNNNQVNTVNAALTFLGRTLSYDV